jgi:hypothetical protein
LLDRERLDELVEEDRDTVCQFMFGRLGSGPTDDHDTTPINQQRTVRRQEFVKHTIA